MSIVGEILPALWLLVPTPLAQQTGPRLPEYRFETGPLSDQLNAILSEPPGGWGGSHLPDWDRPAWKPDAWAADLWNAHGWAVRTTAAEAVGTNRRAGNQLVRLALATERWDDAWRHLANLQTGHASTLLDWFLPGGDWRSGSVGGVPIQEQAGVTLRPALPPPTGLGGVPERRSMELVGFQVGEAQVAMKVSVEGDGIELEFRHLEGAAVEFSAVIPCPPRLVMTAEYANWEAQEGIGLPRAVKLEPGAPPYRLWGRYEPAPPEWPGHAPLEPTQQMELAGFELLVPGDTPEGDDGLPGFAKLVEAVTGLPCRVIRGDPPLERVGPAPVVIDLRAPERRAQKVSALLSLLERHVLGPDLGVPAAARAEDD